jgi:hypothetical protein
MAPLAHFNFNMSPLNDEMFLGLGAFAEAGNDNEDEDVGKDGGANDDDNIDE